MEAAQKKSVETAKKFVEAAERGDSKRVEQALKSSTHGHAEVPLQDDFRFQGLTRAAANNHDNVVELILNRCKHIPLERLMDKVEEDLGITLLHMAAWTGQVQVVQRLLKAADPELGTDMNARTRGGITPLQMASFRGHVATVNALLEWPQVRLDAVTDQERFTALHMAADGGHAQVVHALLSACRGMRSPQDFINATDCLLRTALHYACRNGHSAVVDILLAAPEIDVNPEDAIASFTPLHLACWTPGDRVDVVKLIIAHAHVEVNVRIGHCNKDEAALREKQKEKEEKEKEKQKQREMEKEKEQAEGGRREEKQRERETEKQKDEKEMKMEKEKMKQKEMEMEKVQVKVKAALEEMEKVAWKLLRPRLVDATVHSTMDFENKGFPKKGDTPLHLAAEVGNLRVVTQLLQHTSIDVNAAEDQYGMTALHAAALWGRKLVLTKLLSNEEVNVMVKTDGNVMVTTEGLRFYPDKYAQCEAMNVLHIAVYRGHLNMVQVLVSHSRTALLLNNMTGDCNFVLNGHYYTGLTSLHIAAYFGHKDICTVLLDQAEMSVNPRTEFHILTNAEGCSNSQEQKEDEDEEEQQEQEKGQKQKQKQEKFSREWLHTRAASNQLSLVKQMLSGPGIDQARVDQVMTLLTDPPRVAARLDKFRQFIVSADPEMNGSAKVDLEALIKALSDPKIAASKQLSATFRRFQHADNSAAAKFRRLQHADRCYANMTPLHIAAHRGHLHVLTMMLGRLSSNVVNFRASTGDTVLHIAIHERRMPVIKSLCELLNLQADLRNNAGKTALELVDGLLLERKKEKQEWQEVMDRLLARQDVVKLLDILSKEKQGFQNAANALIVGGSLIAGVTFSGFLQPPIGSAFDSYRTWVVRAFWSFNTLSFFFAICTVVMSISIVMPQPEQFIELELKKVRRDVAFTTSSLAISTCFVIGAFVMAGVGNMPPKAFGSLLLSTVLGGLVTIFFAGIPFLKYWFKEFQRYAQGSSLTELFIEWTHGLRKTFSRREPPMTGLLTVMDELPIEKEPPRPMEARHPHPSLPPCPQPSIFLTARVSGNTLLRHDDIAHTRVSSF